MITTTTLCLIFILLFLIAIPISNNEYFTATSNESIQTISSMYNQSLLSATSIAATSVAAATITTTGDCNIGGAANVTGNIVAPTATIATLDATNATIPTLKSTTGTFANGVFTNGTFTNLSSDNMDVKNPTVSGTLKFNGGTISGIIKSYDNQLAADGWDSDETVKDTNGKIVKANNFGVIDNSDCVSKCMGINATLCALYKKSSKRCWCKQIQAIKSKNNDFTTTFFY